MVFADFLLFYFGLGFTVVASWCFWLGILVVLRLVLGCVLILGGLGWWFTGFRL